MKLVYLLVQIAAAPMDSMNRSSFFVCFCIVNVCLQVAVEVKSNKLYAAVNEARPKAKAFMYPNNKEVRKSANLFDKQ